MKKLLLRFFLLASSVPFIIYSQTIQITGEEMYIQNFNSLANTGESSVLPNGWYLYETGAEANNMYSAGDGSREPGDTKSYGLLNSTERAFGNLRSPNPGGVVATIGASFINISGFTITQLPISFTGEQWRRGNGGADRLDFQMSLDATALNNGTWTDYNGLDFSSPYLGPNNNIRLDGNLPANRTSISFTITGLNIANGVTFWIRWLDFDKIGTDDGLSIDDFMIDESALPVELSFFSAIVLDYGVRLKWRTETEVSNYGFEVERAQGNFEFRNSNFESIGFVEGNGNSNSPKDYTFIDNEVNGGKYSYRLKQFDNDGKFEYSKVIEVNLGSPQRFELSQNYPNPFNPVTTIQFSIPASPNPSQGGALVKLIIYNLLGEEVAVLVNQVLEAGVHTINFNASELNSGLYIYKLESNGFVQSKKMTLIK